MSYDRLTSENAAVLLVDHQTGLSNGVQDQSVPDGTWNHLVQRVAIARMAQAGIKPTTWVAVGAELLADWRTPAGHAHLPFYNNVAVSFFAARQEVGDSHAQDRRRWSSSPGRQRPRTDRPSSFPVCQRSQARTNDDRQLTSGLAKSAKLFGVPTILSTVLEGRGGYQDRARLFDLSGAPFDFHIDRILDHI